MRVTYNDDSFMSPLAQGRGSKPIELVALALSAMSSEDRGYQQQPRPSSPKEPQEGSISAKKP